MLTGSEGGDSEQRAVAYTGDRLGSWTTLDVASTGDVSSVHDAAVSDGQLHLLGSVDGQPTFWALPVDELGVERD